MVRKRLQIFRFGAFGGDKRDRTADLLNAIQALSQLSYTPMFTSLRLRVSQTASISYHKSGKSQEAIRKNLIFSAPEKEPQAEACGALGFPDEFFFAPGAGDGDFSLSLGDAHHLLTFGTVKVPVFPVLDPVQELQKAAVFLIAPVCVFGQHPVQHQDHGNVGQEIEPTVSGEYAHQAQNQIQTQNRQIQLIHTVTAPEHPLEPIAKFLPHSQITLGVIDMLNYMANSAKFNGQRRMFTNCLKAQKSKALLEHGAKGDNIWSRQREIYLVKLKNIL